MSSPSQQPRGLNPLAQPFSPSPCISRNISSPLEYLLNSSLPPNNLPAPLTPQLASKIDASARSTLSPPTFEHVVSLPNVAIAEQRNLQLSTNRKSDVAAPEDPLINLRTKSTPVPQAVRSLFPTSCARPLEFRPSLISCHNKVDTRGCNTLLF